MTCVVGIAHEGAVYMGADSGATQGWTLTHRSDPKVFKTRQGGERCAIGFTTSWRMGQLLRYSLFVPDAPKDRDLFEFMVTDFVEAIRICLKERGYATVENNREWAGEFLVGCRGRLFYVGSDYQVGEFQDGYGAVGCGQDIALGALYALRHSDLGPREKLLAALHAADHFSAGVCAPFNFEELRP